MTSPTNVGSVEVSVVANAKALAKSLRTEVEKAFKELDIGKAIRDSIGSGSLRVPVQVDVDTASLEEKIRKTRIPKVGVPLDPDTDDIPEKVKKTRIPKVSVPLDPLMQAFQQEVRRQTAALSKQVIKIPVDGDTGKLRNELGAELAAVARQTKIQVPTEPGDKGAYEAKLRAAVDSIAARVKASVPLEPDTKAFAARLKAETAAAARQARTTVKVDVDTKGGGALRDVGAALQSISKVLPSIGGISSGVADLGGSLQKVAGNSAQLGGSLSGAFLTATGPVGALVGALLLAAGSVAAVGTAAIVAIPAVSALAGAIAAIPGLLTGIGAGFGALSLGFKGISDAFKPKAGGGGGGGGAGEDPASRARRVAAAERGVEAARRGISAATRGVQAAERNLAEAEERVVEAQRRAAQAQQAINRARIDAKENIEDLTRSLAGAKLSEEDAALGVTEALRELNAAKETGNLPDIQRADLAYRQAIQTLDEAKDTTEDLGIEQADAAKKGVEGSDLVQAALEDQAEALKAVKAAQTGVIDAQSGLISANDGLTSSYDGLKSAQDSLAEANKKAASAGGAGGALGDVVKLAPAAQRFVNAVKALKPAFEDLRLGVQQKLFAGLDKTVTNLGNAWIPALKRVLGSYADTFNGFFKNLGKSLGKPQFIADIETGAEGARKGLKKIGDAISGPLVEAFGTLSAASAPFLEALGDEIGNVVTKFSDWVQAGKESGALQDFFESATKAMRDIFDIGGSVASIIGSIISIIAGRRRIGTSKSPLESFKEGLEKVAKYLDDPAVQEGIRQFFGDLEDGLAAVGKFVMKIPDWIAKIKALKAAITGEGREVAGQAGAGAGKGLVDLGEAARKAGFTPAAGTATGTGVGASTGDGFFAGLREALGRAFTAIPTLLWSGPDSLIGKIKSGLGIASPSTLTTTMGQELINGLMKGIGDKVEELKNKAAELPGKIREGIGNAKDFLVRKGQDFATGLRSGMSLAKESVKSKAGELRTKVGEAFSKASSFLQGRGQQLADGLRTGMNQVAGNVSITASNLKTRVKNAFSNAGTLLNGTGQNLVYGLYNGIVSLGRWLRDRVLAFAQATIPGPLHKFFGIASPSKLMAELGGHLGTGLALGIESEEARVAKAAERLAAAALPDLGSSAVDLYGPAADAAISQSMSVAGTSKVQLEFGSGFSGDWLVDGLKRNIKFRNNGNVQAALGSA